MVTINYLTNGTGLALYSKATANEPTAPICMFLQEQT